MEVQHFSVLSFTMTGTLIVSGTEQEIPANHGWSIHDANNGQQTPVASRQPTTKLAPYLTPSSAQVL